MPGAALKMSGTWVESYQELKSSSTSGLLGSVNTSITAFGIGGSPSVALRLVE
jgi:hypothetical protein